MKYVLWWSHSRVFYRWLTCGLMSLTSPWQFGQFCYTHVHPLEVACLNGKIRNLNCTRMLLLWALCFGRRGFTTTGSTLLSNNGTWHMARFVAYAVSTVDRLIAWLWGPELQNALWQNTVYCAHLKKYGMIHLSLFTNIPSNIMWIS